jgi:pimeloyl-ACP methyl ester carboxylesterase
MTDRPEVPAGFAWHDVQLAGSRLIEVLTGGPDDAFPLVYHCGTPSGATPFPLLVNTAADRGFRTIGYSRPGYGHSTPVEGRNVASAAADTIAVLGSLGYDAGDAFVTLGWSGGGPHALACAGLLGERCLGAGLIAGVAPNDGAGLDWSAGMGAENVAEFELASAGGSEFADFLGVARSLVAAVDDVATVAEALGDLVTDRDKKTILDGELGIGEYLISGLRQAVLEGTAGWHDDDIAFVRSWGLDVGAIDVPVTIWQGSDDRMVPAGHGRWLSQQVAGARFELADGEGHVSVVPIALPHLLDELARVAGIAH